MKASGAYEALPLIRRDEASAMPPRFLSNARRQFLGLRRAR